MEWMNRDGEQPQPASPAAPGAGGSKKAKSGAKLRIASVALLFGVTIIIVALILSVVSGAKPATSEGKLVDNDRLQAVFLNGGQVYFGKIQNLNDKYVQMNEIYYLRVNQTVQPDANAAAAAQNDISLVKLGCELHGPQDEMQINRAQVIFWENLKDDGQVAKAVDDYKQQNPDGQDCDAQAQQQATPTTEN
jgi:hypothetical protein